LVSQKYADFKGLLAPRLAIDGVVGWKQCSNSPSRASDVCAIDVGFGEGCDRGVIGIRCATRSCGLD